MTRDVSIYQQESSRMVSTKDSTEDNRQRLAKKRHVFFLLWLIAGLLVFIVWAASFEIDQSVRAQGQVIPTTRTQVIQAAEGGVIADIYVSEGDFVEKGDLLAVFEKERPQSAYEQVRAKIASLEAAKARAQAVLNGTTPVFGDRVQDYPGLVQVERAVYQSRKRALDEEIAVKQQSLQVAEEELEMQESLFSNGDTSRLEVMRAQRRVSEVHGQMLTLQNEYWSRAGEDLSRIQAELSQQRHRLLEQKYVLSHTKLRSPVAGSVKFLRVNTLGGVLKPGDELMQISPTDGEVLLEVKVNPSDIAGLDIGLPASIKFDAYDYARFGALEGRVTYVSTDTLTEDSDGGRVSYYRAHIQVNTNQPTASLSPSMLKQGMTARVDIRTGKRTVLEYIAKPIVRAFDGAMSER